jgi:hypothetical protein
LASFYMLGLGNPLPIVDEQISFWLKSNKSKKRCPIILGAEQVP